MGSCSFKKHLTSKKIAPVIQLQYSRQALIKIKNRKSNDPNPSLLEVAFHLSEPLHIYSELIFHNSLTIHISFSILPGIDPRNDTEKVCQDTCFVISNENVIFIGLYDGHGTFGEKVVNFCSHLAQGFFPKFTDFSSPIEFLHFVTAKCDEELLKSEINCKLSGCTQVLFLLYESKIYCASLGDSRAILATSNPPDLAPTSYSGGFHQSSVLEEVRSRRNSQVFSFMVPLQLTFDQKPDLPEELARITNCGGRVDQLKSTNGQAIGPYRVWEENSNTPGISVSRALGDSDCKKLGIISEPICSTHELLQEDYFAVIASDGLWDVMDNSDVVNFIENNRAHCKRQVKFPVQGHIITAENSCISQMLCEEARVRWFSVVKEEDVNIDDISCVVLEFRNTPQKITPKFDTKTTDTQSIVMSVHKFEGVFSRDPRRGSLVLPSSAAPVII